MSRHTILCVDDEQSILASLRRVFRKEDYTVLTALSGKEGLELLQENPVDLIISDQRMPEMTGAQLLKEVKRSSPSTIRIILSGYTEVNSITSAINEGNVYKFILKPWDDEGLRITIKRALEPYDLVRENERLHEKIKEQNEELKEFINAWTKKSERERKTGILDNEALAFSQDFLENLPIAIIGISESQTKAFINKKAQEIFGNKIESFLRLNMERFFSEETLSLMRDVPETNHTR